MAKRINVILPEETLRAIDRLARPGQRSRFIPRAVQHYVATASPEALQERLKQAAIRDRDLDLEISHDWFAVDQEQWRQLDTQENTPVPTGRKEAKSTSQRSTRQSGTRSRRPSLIVQNDASNRYSAIAMVAPIASTVRLPLSPLHVLLPGGPLTGLTVPSVAVFNQIRAVERRRLIEKLGKADAAAMAEADLAIQAAFGLPPSGAS
jgi:mRNA-degrading endonuclease toxin of MazEF toxin-antitoxin module